MKLTDWIRGRFPQRKPEGMRGPGAPVCWIDEVQEFHHAYQQQEPVRITPDPHEADKPEDAILDGPVIVVVEGQMLMVPEGYQAVRFLQSEYGGGLEFSANPPWLDIGFGKHRIVPVFAKDNYWQLSVLTARGRITARAGDWIMYNIHTGEFHIDPIGEWRQA